MRQADQELGIIFVLRGEPVSVVYVRFIEARQGHFRPGRGVFGHGPVIEGGLGQTLAIDGVVVVKVEPCADVEIVNEPLLAPFRSDKRLNGRLSELDRLYAAVSTALDQLVDAVGLKAA